MVELPHGTVTFLFTDIEGSTRLWRDFPQAMPAAYARHDAILRSSVSAHGGVVYKVIGDAMQIAFPTAPAALAAATQAQAAFQGESWEVYGLTEPLHIRMALHAGAVDPDVDGDYRSPVLNRLGRLLGVGHGAQILVSAAVHELAWEHLPPRVSLRDLGEHRLKDLETPSRVFQVLHPDLPDRFPPLAGYAHHPHNLPSQATPFLGREREVVAVADLLRRPDVRLLTLTGPGGTGKTRLSLQVAADLLDAFPDGVWAVELAPLTDPETIPSAIAAVLGTRLPSGESWLTALKNDLREKRLLLVLDNVEHVLSGSPVASELLAAAPGVKILATSRTPLRLRGEREFAVAPLSVPNPRRSESLDRLTKYDAVRLFIARAQDVRPDFAVDNANASAVAEICWRLDGLPLAIELAAARLKMLPPEALLRRLEQRLPLLSSSTRDVPERQRTLRAAIAWSFDLLTADERVLFRRLAVFVGGFTLDKVEAVTNSDGALDVFSGIEALVNHSLLRQAEDAQGEPRFMMLETIREYAREQLAASGEDEELAVRHAEAFRDLVEEGERQLQGADQAHALARLDTELDNLRAALGASVEFPDRTTALRIASALRELWEVRGLYDEGVAWLERSLDGASPCAEQVKALAAGAMLIFKQGDLERSEALSTDSLELARALGDEPGVATALTALGTAAKSRGDFDRAERLLGESLAILRRLGDARGAIDVLNQLTITARNRGDLELAATLQKEVLQSARAVTDQRRTAIALVNLALLARDRGVPDEAPRLLEEALLLARELGDKSTMVNALGLLGLSEVDAGDPAAGAARLSAALALIKQSGDRKTAIWILEALATAAVGRSRPEPASRILGAAATLRERLHVPMPALEQVNHDRDVTAIRSNFDDATMARAWQIGQDWRWEQLIAEAQTLAEELSKESDGVS